MHLDPYYFPVGDLASKSKITKPVVSSLCKKYICLLTTEINNFILVGLFDFLLH